MFTQAKYILSESTISNSLPWPMHIKYWIFIKLKNLPIWKEKITQIKAITSADLSPHVKRRCFGLAAFESHPRYSYKLVDVYTHLGTFWKDDSNGTLPQVTTFKRLNKSLVYSVSYAHVTTQTSIVIKLGPVIDPVKALGHWFNQWVTSWTGWTGFN